MQEYLFLDYKEFVSFLVRNYIEFVFCISSSRQRKHWSSNSSSYICADGDLFHVSLVVHGVETKALFSTLHVIPKDWSYNSESGIIEYHTPYKKSLVEKLVYIGADKARISNIRGSKVDEIIASIVNTCTSESKESDREEAPPAYRKELAIPISEGSVIGSDVDFVFLDLNDGSMFTLFIPWKHRVETNFRLVEAELKKAKIDIYQLSEEG